ncbi:MAG: type II secretion system protein [Phycisphaerales bacterium]|nr:type II secretion system protein [Phycisphaerales bacterium]
MRRRDPIGFTIIELLIVIGIISLLIGVVMTALIAIRQQGRKALEKNEIRQVGNAWLKYSQVHKERIAPGWLSPSTQSQWEMELTYPDGTLIPPAPSYGTSQPNVAGPWTWRLLPYMDNDMRLVRGHLDRETINNWDEMDDDWKLEIAESPSFGLNGYFLGGVWDRWYSDIRRSHPRFVKVQDANQRTVNLTTTSQTMLTNPSRVIAFISNGRGEPGSTPERLDSGPGHWLAVPHRLADEPQWNLTPGLDIEFAEGDSAPLGRHEGPPVSWHPDGHVETYSFTDLLDQRLWIDRASGQLGFTGSDYRYTEP